METSHLAPQDQTPDGGQPITLDLVVRTLRQGIGVVIRTAMVVFGLSAILAFILPTVYTSSAVFVPPGVGGSSSAAALMGQISSLGAGALLGGAGKGQGDTYVGILKSRSVELLLVRRFNLKVHYKTKTEAQAADVLFKRSNFDVDTKSAFVTLSVTDRSAAMAHDLADGYLQALQEVNTHLQLTESSQRRAFYENRLEEAKKSLADAEVALQQAQKQTGLIAPAGQTSSEIQTLANLQAQITGRQVQLASLRANETENNPDVVQLRQEIVALQAQQRQMENGENKNGYGHFSTAQVPELQTQYIRRARDVKYHEALFDIIAKQYEAARLDEAKDSPVQILDEADQPEQPSGPKRKLIMAIGLLAGLIIGSSWVLARAAFHQER